MIALLLIAVVIAGGLGRKRFEHSATIDRDNTIYVADTEGNVRGQFGGTREMFRGDYGCMRGLKNIMTGQTGGLFGSPTAVSFLSDGRLLVGDWPDREIEILSLVGNF